MEDEKIVPAAAPTEAVTQPVVEAVVPELTKPDTKAVVEPEKPVAPEPEKPVAGEPAAPHELTIPTFIPLSEQTPERSAMVEEFSRVAPSAGLNAETSQGLLDLVTDAATMLTYQPVDQHTTAEDTFAALEQTFGREAAVGIANRAQRFVAQHKGLGDYLDRTGLGDDLGVVVSLSLAQQGVLAHTPEKAQAEISRLMQTDAYRRGDKQALLMIHALSRIANKGEAKKEQAVAKKTVADIGAAAKAAVQAELTSLAAKKSLSEKERARWISLITTLTK